jgi:molybdate transport system regulatory protein
MKMSYKGVWSKIKATEKHLSQNIVHADRKEGTRLTRQGKELLEKYKQLEKKCMASDDRIFSKIFK